MTESKTQASIDVLLPFYGDVDLMKETVESVRIQSFKDWRLVVVDDGQPDESVKAWVERLNDRRIEYVRNERNLGANANYRKALSLARAELVVMMGADDRMRPDYLKAASRALMANPKASMYHPGVQVIDSEGRPTATLADRLKKILRPRQAEIEGQELVTSLLRGNWTYFPAICWRAAPMRDIGFRQEFDIVQDMALIVDLTLAGHAMVVDEEITFEYRRHAASDSSLKSLNGLRFEEEVRLNSQLARSLRELGWSAAARTAQLRPTSRLHAAVWLSQAVRRGDGNAVRALARYLFV